MQPLVLNVRRVMMGVRAMSTATMCVREPKLTLRLGCECQDREPSGRANNCSGLANGTGENATHIGRGAHLEAPSSRPCPSCRSVLAACSDLRSWSELPPRLSFMTALTCALHRFPVLMTNCSFALAYSPSVRNSYAGTNQINDKSKLQGAS